MGPGVVSRVACTKVADWIENIWLPSAIEVDAFDYEAPCVSAVPLPEVSPTDNPEDNSKFQEFATFWQNAVLGDAWFQWGRNSQPQVFSELWAWGGRLLMAFNPGSVQISSGLWS